MRSKLQGELQKVGAVLVGGIDGEPPAQLATGEPPTFLSSPVWSPDGRWIEYARILQTLGQSYSAVIEVRPSDGGPAKTLVSAVSLPLPPLPVTIGPTPAFGGRPIGAWYSSPADRPPRLRPPQNTVSGRFQ